MTLLFGSFVAGFLTVLAPCVLPLLPVILAGAAADKKSRRLSILMLGLAVSVIVFSLLLKSFTILLGVPQIIWQMLSGAILFLFGIALVFPTWWEGASLVLGRQTNRALVDSQQETGIWGDFLLGAALGPVFNSCSPTYALIVAVILPASLLTGLINLVAYVLGLSLALLLIALFGRSLIAKLGWAINPHGWFRKVIGILLVVAGLAIILGWDKKFQTFVLDRGYYQPIIQLEERVRFR